MSQKIKKHLKRSMPWLMIASLIVSSAAVGLVFNFEINYPPFSDTGGKTAFSLPEARADTASTTVQVRNAPPRFTGAPSESPTSTSTTPVNFGGSLSFTATAHDDETNGYYLIVCTTDSVIASTTGGAPTCGGGLLCVSGMEASDDPSQCTYSPVNLAAETQEWFAFVCDNHSSQGECSNAQQGTDDGGSPFYINHAPTLNLVSATVDFQEPGGTFTFTATSTDDDDARSGDEIKLYICDDQGWATSTGCVGVTYCSSTPVQAISNEAVTACSWDDTEPTQDNSYPVYAYIEDEFYLPGVNNGTTTTYTIINVAPVVQGVNLVPNDGNEILLNLKGNTTLVLATSTNVSDQNGCNDLVAATGTIYWSSATDDYNCAADSNNCYPILSASCEIGNCVGAVAEVTCTTTLEYHAVPTDDDAYYAATTWLAAIAVRDEALFGIGTTSLPGTDVNTNMGMEVSEPLIDYDILVAGSDTGTSTATTTVVNFGNSPIDSAVSGTWMAQGIYHFGEDYQEYATTTNFEWDGGIGRDLSSTTPFTLDVDVSRPISTTTDMLDYVYWGIGIPPGQMSGVYNGVNTFDVAIDPDGTW